MRNINKPVLFLFRRFLNHNLFTSFNSVIPASNLIGKRVVAYTGKKNFKLRLREPFKIYKLSSFVATRVRGTIIKTKFSKTKVKKK